MKKSIRTLSLVFILILLFSFSISCKKEETPVVPSSSVVEKSESSVVEKSSSVVEPSSSEVAPEPWVTDKYTSKTTGIKYDTEWKFLPVQMQIENSVAARPQTGLNEADIVYEAPAEGSITRFSVIFNDNSPVVAGPCRSLRMNFMQIQTEWDSILVHFGGPPVQGEEFSIYGPKYDKIKVTLNGVWGKHEKYFWRSTDRKAPHNAYTSIKNIVESFPDYKSDKTEFWAHSDTPTTSDKTARIIEVPYMKKSAPYVEWRYNEDTGMYDRYEGGKRFETYRNSDKNKRTVEGVSVRNLVVQYVSMKTANTGDGHRIIYLTGKGKSEVFIGGKWISGTWERKSDTSLTHFYDENGNDITFAVGNTWICQQPDSSKIRVE